MKKNVDPILVLSWHPGSSNIQTAGGFKRLFYILTHAESPVVVIDKFPSIYKSLDNKNVRIIEYGKLLNFRFLEKFTPLLYKFLDRLLSLVLIFFKVIFLTIRFKVIYISFSELPHLTILGVLFKYVYRVPLVLCNLNVNTFSLDGVLNRFLHKKAELVITISKDLQLNLKDAGIVATRINTVGFDMEPFLHQEKTVKKYDAIFVGRHIEEKGIFDLITIWGLVKKQSKSSVKLLTIGDIPVYLKDKLFAEMEKNGLNEKDIKMVGNISDEKKIDAYFESKLCVFPSHHEGWGITPIEALAAGIPVVLYDLTVYEESLAGCKGVFRVKENDVQMFADIIIKELENKTDYGKVNYAAIVKNDWKTIAEQEYALILSV